VTCTIAELGSVYPDVRMARARLTSWAAYLADLSVVLFHTPLTDEQEASAVATMDHELSAAGVPRVPSPRGPVGRE
jgi:hypothetical protein